MYAASQIRELICQHAEHIADTDIAARTIDLLMGDPRNVGIGLREAILQQIRLAVGVDVSLETVQRIFDALAARFRLESRLQTVWNDGGGLTALADQYPWPAHPVPDLNPRHDLHFTGPGLHALLTEALPAHAPEIIVEIGAWLGGSTRLIAETSAAQIICVDTWLGSEEHQAGRAWRERDPNRADLMTRLFDQFVVNSFDLQDRVIPMRTTSVYALHHLRALDIIPDLIILDGAHDAYSVACELDLCRHFFPQAHVIVDDYAPGQIWLRGLVSSVNQFAREHHQQIIVAEDTACLLASW